MLSTLNMLGPTGVMAAMGAVLAAGWLLGRVQLTSWRELAR